LLEHGHDVWVVDNLSAGHRAAVPADRLVVADLADTAAVDHVLVTRRIEAVVHFAALCYVGVSVHEPAVYYRNNTVNTLNLLDLCRRNGVDRFVFSSTCATYGMPVKVPITEDNPQKPINPYGHTKLAIEFALADFATAYGLGYAALRYFNAAGASRDGSIGEDHHPETHLIPLVLQVALAQRPHIEIFGTDYPTPDGTCVRDYVHVEDLAEAHRLALEKIESGKGLCLNLGTGRGYSNREVVRTAAEVVGKPIASKDGPRRPGDPPELVAAADLARQTLGWKPRYPELGMILETAWAWHRTHPHGYADR
jgi:UDP-glucose-4-epimerase GalE